MPVVAVSVSPGRRTPLVAGATVFAGTAIVAVVSARPPAAIALPVTSVAAAENVGITVPVGAPPAVALASVMVYGPAPEPVTLENVQPVLVPVFESIAVVSVVIGSENVTAYVAAVRVSDVNDVLATVGATVSTVAVADSVIVGPVSVSASVTASTASVTVTSPWEPVAPVGATVSVYGPLPEPVMPVMPQPEAPPIEKSPVVRPVTGSVKESENVIGAEAEATFAVVGAKLATTGRDLE